MPEMARARAHGFVLTDSRPLRFTTLLLFYLTQGFPIGLFFFALPAWMAANGVGTGAIASVVGAAALPWTLKIANGFLIDRYTFLPMGRRRVWIIGAQGTLVMTLIAGAALSPAAHNVVQIAALGFLANLAVTFQDVGIDSLAIDIMPEEERARAGGIMAGAQFVGASLTTATGGWLLARFGIATCLLVLAVIPALVMLFATVIREREGEKRLPWSPGRSHPHNDTLVVEAWWPLLRSATRAVLAPVSLLLLPILLIRVIPEGGFEAFHPVLYQQYAGWTPTQYTGFISALTLASGLCGILAGGWLVGRIGPQRAVALALAIGMLSTAAMGANSSAWSDERVLMAFQIAMETTRLIYFIAVLTLAMRVCDPAVAATQFTIYMGISNFGRPIGAALAANTSGAGNAPLLYFSIAAIWGMGLLLVLLVRYPGEEWHEQHGAERLPHGEGPAPEYD